MGVPTHSMMKNSFLCLMAFLLLNAIISCCAVSNTRRWGTGSRDILPEDDMLSTIGGAGPVTKKTLPFDSRGLSREEAYFFGDGLPADTLHIVPRGRVRYSEDLPNKPFNKLHPIRRM